MTRLIGTISICFMVAAIAACDPGRATNEDDPLQNDNTTSASNKYNYLADGCPAEQPEYDAACDLSRDARCDYFIRESYCFPGVSDYDIYNHCECEEGKWRCSPDYEDCPPDTADNDDEGITCPADGPEYESSCDARYEGMTCDYFVRGSYCMPGVPDYDIYDHCSCTDGTWSCRQDLEDCHFPEPDAGSDG